MTELVCRLCSQAYDPDAYERLTPSAGDPAWCPSCATVTVLEARAER